MIKDERNYHQRLQEFCDCFMETDFKKELEAASKGVSGDPSGDPDELGLKFLGITLLYGANEEAKRISLQRFPWPLEFWLRGRSQLRMPAMNFPLHSCPLPRIRGRG